MRNAIPVLRPPFVVGGIGRTASLGRLAVYSIGFFLCRAFAAASSAFTVLLVRTARGRPA